MLVTGAIDERSPLLARVYTGFIDPSTVETSHLPLPARTSDGAEVTPFVASVVLSAHRQPDLEEYNLSPAGSVFGSVIRLTGAAVSAPVAMATTPPQIAWQRRK